MKVLVTGAAGFIGFHLVTKLCERDDEVVGIDNINDYYSVTLKYARLEELGVAEEKIIQGHEIKSTKYNNYRFRRIDLTDKESIEYLCKKEKFDIIVNLAAQAGVRYSIENPYAYLQSNIVGFLNLLECIQKNPIKHFVYASSSSVYGGNTKIPFSEEDRVDDQVSIYAATKRSNELIANVYSKLYKIPTTGLRFFTVYGPWGRPDMAPMIFAKAILAGKPIKVFNNGNLFRDFTYIDDIVKGVIRVIDKVPEKEIPADIYNIGHGTPVSLMDFIHILENALGKKAEMNLQPMQQGDVYTTYADTTKLSKIIGYNPKVDLVEGIDKFVNWYRAQHSF